MHYNWRLADGNDVPSMVAMAQTHFEREIDNIFTPDPVAYSRNLTLAVVNTFFCPNNVRVAVCNNDANVLLAYTWCVSGEVAPWSDDPMVLVKMAHVDLDLSTRIRLKLLDNMFDIWDKFAIQSRTPIICSTTMRHDQSAFLKMHSKRGWDVRGSYAYKKITLV